MAKPFIARTHPSNKPSECSENPAASCSNRSLSFTGKPIWNASSIASIVGHRTPWWLKKVEWAMPHAKHKSIWDAPANQRIETASLVFGRIQDLELLAALMLSWQVRWGEITSRSSSKVAQSIWNIFFNAEGSSWFISSIAYPLFRWWFLAYLRDWCILLLETGQVTISKNGVWPHF